MKTSSLSCKTRSHQTIIARVALASLPASPSPPYRPRLVSSLDAGGSLQLCVDPVSEQRLQKLDRHVRQPGHSAQKLSTSEVDPIQLRRGGPPRVGRGSWCVAPSGGSRLNQNQFTHQDLP